VALTRREALVAAGALLLGGGGAYALVRGGEQPRKAATSQTGRKSSCLLAPEQTEGPYYLDGSMLRRDIAEGRDGAPLELRLTVQQADSCEPIENATVELWHCDAAGVYSGVDGESGRFCRGGQRTGRDGVATLETVYPGWYQGRAPHIHVKVHVGGNEVHTGQLYFDEAASAAVYRRAPYAARGQAQTPNSADGIYAQGGRESTVALRPRGKGYVGRLAMGVRS
jgi:protocatechuate 3,4-dioxygenase beta subunit